MCFLGYSAFHYGYRCLSLTSGKLYISRDIIFIENVYPYKEQSPITNLHTQLTLGLLGSSPTTINLTDTPQVIPSSTISSLTTSTSPKHSSPVSSTSLLEQCHSLPISSELHHTHHSSHSLSLTIKSPNLSTTGHIPSTDPLSPSNMDAHNINSNVKTRCLSDILITIDLGNATHTIKFPLPACSSHTLSGKLQTSSHALSYNLLNSITQICSKSTPLSTGCGRLIVS